MIYIAFVAKLSASRTYLTLKSWLERFIFLVIVLGFFFIHFGNMNAEMNKEKKHLRQDEPEEAL